MNRKGFTLIELLITLGILALLLVIAVPSVISNLNRGKEKSYDIMKENMKSAAQSYITECRYASSSVCDSSVNWNGDSFVFSAIELASKGFLSVSGDLADGQKIYNPMTKKDVSDCLKVYVSINSSKYTYNVVDTECE